MNFSNLKRQQQPKYKFEYKETTKLQWLWIKRNRDIQIENIDKELNYKIMYTVLKNGIAKPEVIITIPKELAKAELKATRETRREAKLKITSEAELKATKEAELKAINEDKLKATRETSFKRIYKPSITFYSRISSTISRRS